MIKKIVSIFLCLFWMGVIFYNSSNSGDISNKKSNNLVKIIQDEYHKINLHTPVSLNEKDNKSSENKEQPKTKENTGKAIDEKNKIIDKKEKINIFIRKNAHAFEYLILAILVSNLFSVFNYSGKKAIIYVLFIGLFYAVTDEFHQLFVPGRTSSVEDVLIDFIGTIVGTLLFYTVNLFFNIKKQKKGL